MDFKQKIEKILFDYENESRWNSRSMFNGLPAREPPIKDDPNKDKIQIAFGLEAQGQDLYVERLLNTGCGWNQIGKAIGWIGFGAFKSYYNLKYRKLFDENGIFLTDPNQGLREGDWYYNLEERKIDQSLITEDVSYQPLRNEILNIPIFVKDEEKFEKMNKSIDLYFETDLEKESDLLTFHTTMSKDGQETMLFGKNLQDLIVSILEHKEGGYERVTEVFYDIASIQESKKHTISKTAIEFYKKVGITF